jgi:hypothetical protein
VIAAGRGRLADLARTAWPAAFMLLGAALLLVFPPTQYSFYPQCPVHYYFHILCPGCGTTRALAALLHGSFTEALRLNALTTLMIPISLMYVGRYHRRVLAREPAALLQPSPAAIYATLAVAAIFTIARNL